MAGRVKQFNLYLIRNIINGKMYVGKTTKTIARRWNKHPSDARRRQYPNHLQESVAHDESRPLVQREVSPRISIVGMTITITIDADGGGVEIEVTGTGAANARRLHRILSDAFKIRNRGSTREGSTSRSSS
jgi:hypothetical protein